MKKIAKITLPLCLGLIMFSCGQKEATNQQEVHNTNKTLEGYSIAFVDTDTLFAKYALVDDVMNELSGVEKKLTQDYQNQMNAFKNEYENYLKVGATMTLNEQKKKEEYLTKRQQDLMQLEGRYADQLLQVKAQKNIEVQDKIFKFIDEYNKAHQQFDLILSKARTSGVLFSDAAKDITQEVLSAMNEEYAKTKKK